MAVPEFLQKFSVIWLAHIGPDDWALESGLHSRTPWRVYYSFACLFIFINQNH